MESNLQVKTAVQQSVFYKGCKTYNRKGLRVEKEMTAWTVKTTVQQFTEKVLLLIQILIHIFTEIV